MKRNKLAFERCIQPRFCDHVCCLLLRFSCHGQHQQKALGQVEVDTNNGKPVCGQSEKEGGSTDSGKQALADCKTQWTAASKPNQPVSPFRQTFCRTAGSDYQVQHTHTQIYHQSTGAVASRSASATHRQCSRGEWPFITVSLANNTHLLRPHFSSSFCCCQLSDRQPTNCAYVCLHLCSLQHQHTFGQSSEQFGASICTTVGRPGLASSESEAAKCKEKRIENSRLNL